MNKESYYYTNENGDKFFVYVDEHGEEHHCICDENEDDEYDSCRCGNVENGKY